MLESFERGRPCVRVEAHPFDLQMRMGDLPGLAAVAHDGCILEEASIWTASEVEVLTLPFELEVWP